VVEQTLGDVLAVIPDGQRVVHCCAAEPPIALLRGSGANAISVDAAQPLDEDAVGEAVEAGTSLWLGVVPGTDATISLDSAREPVRKLWRELGFGDERLATSVVPTPACGLAGASPTYARRALGVVRDVGRSLRDLEG
jgi:hypothetical protein